MGVLEYLAPGNWDTARRNFERLDRLFSLASKDSDGFGFTVAGISVRFGISTVTFTASRVSAAKSVTHGLGKTPAVVLVSGSTDQGPSVIAYHAFTYTSTTFSARGDFTNGTAPTGNSNFAWLAIG